MVGRICVGGVAHLYISKNYIMRIKIILILFCMWSLGIRMQNNVTKCNCIKHGCVKYTFL